MPVFNYVFCKSHEKHLTIQWLPWRQNKRYLTNFTFYDTFKDEPIPHKNFTFLSQWSYVILVGSASPFGIQCSTKTLGIRKVEGTFMTFR